jgi:hypothetical protein
MQAMLHYKTRAACYLHSTSARCVTNRRGELVVMPPVDEDEIIRGFHVCTGSARGHRHGLDPFHAVFRRADAWPFRTLARFWPSDGRRGMSHTAAPDAS